MINTTLLITTLVFFVALAVVTTLYVVFKKRVRYFIGSYQMFLQEDLPFCENKTDDSIDEFYKLLKKCIKKI